MCELLNIIGVVINNCVECFSNQEDQEEKRHKYMCVYVCAKVCVFLYECGMFVGILMWCVCRYIIQVIMFKLIRCSKE